MPAVIFGRFWDPLGSQNGFQNGSWVSKLGLNWALGVPREPQEPILVDLGQFWIHLGSPDCHFGTLLAAFWSIQQQIAAKMVIWASYWDIFCSKQQLIASNSSKQEQIVANSTKQRQVSSKKSQILVIIIIIISSSSRPDQQKPGK